MVEDPGLRVVESEGMSQRMCIPASFVQSAVGILTIRHHLPSFAPDEDRDGAKTVTSR